jgi:DNA-binding CsgD family transcriptional regulator
MVDRDRLLELIADTHGLLDIEELRAGMLDAVVRAVPADYASLNDVSPDPERTVAIVAPELSPEAIRAFAELAHENPLVQRYQSTRDGRAYRFSDVVTPDDLHGRRIYREFYGPLGLEHQIAFTLPSRAERILAIALTRRETDFSDDERDLLNLARPFLIQSYQNAIAHGQALAAADADPARVIGDLRDLGLSLREAEVVRLVALGRSNRDVGATLGITERTVAKHLQHCFTKLGAANRSEAAGIVWTLASDPVRARARLERLPGTRTR